MSAKPYKFHFASFLTSSESEAELDKALVKMAEIDIQIKGNVRRTFSLGWRRVLWGGKNSRQIKGNVEAPKENENRRG